MVIKLRYILYCITRPKSARWYRGSDSDANPQCPDECFALSVLEIRDVWTGHSALAVLL